MEKPIINPIRKLVIAAIKALREEKYADVVNLCEQVIDRSNDHAGAHSMLFTSLYNLGELERARIMGGKAADLNPTSEFILNNQACLQLDAKHPAAAATLLRSLIKQHGPKAKWLYNLGLAQRSVGSYKNAVDVFGKTLEVNPSHERAAFQLADSYQHCGNLEMATRQFNYLRLLRPHHRETRRWYIYHAARNATISKHELQQEISLWGSRFIPEGKTYPANSLTKSKSRKIGFIVGDISATWWTSMVLPVINQLSTKENVFVYWQSKQDSIGKLADPVTLINTIKLSDSDFARQVRQDEIDIIIDVCGMRAGCRQRVLGLQLASKQFGWLVHEGYYISDKIIVIEHLFGPQKYAMKPPEKRATNLPINLTTNINPKATASVDTSKEKTFFCINCAPGLTKRTVATWAAVLNTLPDWNMLLEVKRTEVASQIRNEFAAIGIDSKRLEFAPTLKPSEGTITLENLNSNDIISVANAVMAGSVLIALEGESFLTQQSSTLLKQLGKEEWVATDLNSYVQRIDSIVNDGELKKLSKKQIDQSDIFDIAGFARRFRRIIR